MKLEQLERKLVLPQDVTAAVDGTTVTITGPKGTLFRTFPKILSFKVAEKTLFASVLDVSRHEKRFFFTSLAHLFNMITGVTEGFTYKLKICSGHFPMTVNVDGSHLIIKNFLGEKIPRKGVILPLVKVIVAGDTITVTGYDLEKVGQTAANIEHATNIKGRDKRVFQDGCYITEKRGVAL